MNSVVTAASLATSTAIAEPSLASAVSSGADAALLNLGIKLDRISAEWLAQVTIDRAHSEEFEAQVEQETGQAFRDAGPWLDAAKPEEEWSKDGYWAVRGRILTERSSRERDADVVNVWNDIQGRLYPLIDEIMSCKATTLAGITVQTNAAVMFYSDWWDRYGNNEVEGPSGPGNEEGRARDFFEALSSFLNIVPAPIQNAYQDAGLTHVSGVPVAALPDDPIFAAIEAYHRACEEERRYGPALEEAEFRGDEEASRKTQALQDAAHVAWQGLIEVIPTTVAGVSALLAFVAESDSAWAPEWMNALHRNLARVLPTLAA